MYKVLSLSGYPLNTGYKIVYSKEDNTKQTAVDKVAMKAITGSDTELVENSIEGILNYLESKGWKLFGFDEDKMFIFVK